MPQIGDADAAQYVFIGKEIARAGATVANEDGVGTVGHDFRFARAADNGAAAEQVLYGSRGNDGCGPESIHGYALRAKLFRHAKHAHAHAVF